MYCSSSFDRSFQLGNSSFLPDYHNPDYIHTHGDCLNSLMMVHVLKPSLSIRNVFNTFLVKQDIKTSIQPGLHEVQVHDSAKYAMFFMC